jgi:hypothetical protein
MKSDRAMRLGSWGIWPLVALCALGAPLPACSDVGDSSAVQDGAPGSNLQGDSTLPGDDSAPPAAGGDSTGPSSETGSSSTQADAEAETSSSPGPDTGAIDTTEGAPSESGTVTSENDSSPPAEAGADAPGATVATDASPADSTVDSASEADSAAADAESSAAETGPADTGSDVQTQADAGVDAGDASAPVPCTGGTYPSNTPTGCVPCLGNRQTGADEGQCTATEQIVMSYDIVKNGMTPTSNTVAATSCYYCLVAGTCLDSVAAASAPVGIGIAHVVTHNKQGLECEDPQTATNVAAGNPADCRDALQCTLTGGGTLSDGMITGGTGECTTSTPDMASSDPNASVGNCYCGTAIGAACLTAGNPNGSCATNITTDVGSFLASNTPTDISGALTDGSQSPGGVGVEILNCGLTSNCNVCFK